MPPGQRHAPTCLICVDSSAGHPDTAVGRKQLPPPLPNTRTIDGEIASPIESLEKLLREGSTTLVRAAFEHSYFADPEKVRGNTPLYPDRARTSREHYPKLQKGALANWNGRTVKLDGNAKAQQAWRRYTGRPIQRGSGYGVRHVWGHPWDPDAFTAGWNLCYMPYWAGMLTEDQHPHLELVTAVRQAAWNLYFRDDPVCPPPEFVNDPGRDLDAMLEGLPVLILSGPAPTATPPNASSGDIDKVLREVRSMRRQSWSNLCKAALALQAKTHSPFSTSNVENAAKSAVRLMGRRTGLSLVALEERLTALSSIRRE